MIGISLPAFGIAVANIIGAVYAGRLLNNWLIRNDSALVDEKAGHRVWQDYLSDLKSLKRLVRFK